MHKIRCVIVDDEELARALIKTYILKIEHLECVAAFENPITALAFLKSKKVDLLFLDIHMPELQGTDFAELMRVASIRIIFTTAYSEYALKGFELNALDYLLKPITFKRFLAAAQKYSLPDQFDDDYIVIKSGHELHKIPHRNIVFIKSNSEYVHYYLTNGNKIMENQSLSKLEKQLPISFLRVHRSYIVKKEKITGLKGRILIMEDFQIPVSDSYYAYIKKQLFGS